MSVIDDTELPSPSLIVHLAAFEANVTAANDLLRDRPKRLRPHVKTHRTPALAMRQLTAATAGLTCATVGEAETMVEAGADDVLVANEVIGAEKLARLAVLAHRARVGVAVDSAEGVRALGEAARRGGAEILALVDVDVGLGRCGVAGPDAAVELARVVEQTPGLRLEGIMGYEGRLRSGDAGRMRTISRAYETLAETKAAFDRSGLAAGTVSSAGTSTLREALADPVITEIQAGTYALMETDLDGLELPFVPAYSVLATVISRTADRAVLDVGRKSIACDYGPPTPLMDGAELAAIHEEHTVLRFSRTAPPLGERIELRPSHVRLTFNLHDFVWLTRDDGSFECATVGARGRSW
jgi:D-serine deaminase-like pyridoxal phosphate-dependent protein